MLDAKKTGYHIASRRRSIALAFQSHSFLWLGALDELGMGACGNNLATLAIFHLVDTNLGESETASYFFSKAFDLNFFSKLGTGLVCHMDVYADACLLANVKRCDRHTARPIAYCSRNCAVQAAGTIHVIGAERQACNDMALGSGLNLDWREKEGVDRACWYFRGYEVLDVNMLWRLAIV